MSQDASHDDGQHSAWRGRQAALADFGRYALRSADLDAILREGCVLAARGLGVPIAKVLEVLPGGRDLVLRAAIGLSPEVATPGLTRVPSGDGSAAGHALKTDEPVISDVATETRFTTSEIVRRAGVKTSANVLIRTEGQAFGTLEVDSLEPRVFTEDDINFLRTYANLLAAAVERQRRAALIQTLAQEREILLRELQHRVKNDLQVIVALLTLEARQTNSVETRARLQSVSARVASLRLLHDRLFMRGRVGQVDLADYLRELSRDRFRVHGLEPDGDVKLELALATVQVDHDQAVSIGLIANEFITNSLKYAFPMGHGTVGVTLRADEPGRIRLELRDDGIGIPAAQHDEPAGLGMRLVAMLAQQIDAEAEWSSGRGTRLTLTLPA